MVMPALPVGFRSLVDDDEGVWEISRPWKRSTGVVLLIGAAGYFVYTGGLVAAGVGLDGLDLEMLGYILAAAIPALAFGFLGLRHLVNSTVYRIRRGVIEINKGPVWRQEQLVSVKDIEQLYVKDHGTPARPFFSVYANLRSTPRPLLIVYGSTSAEDSRAIEAELEQRLGIANQPVHDEAR